MEKIVALILEGNVASAICTLSKSRHGVSQWFLAHFAEVFHWGEVRWEFTGHAQSDELDLHATMKHFREDAMKQYISSLMKIDTSWKIGSSYALVACGETGPHLADIILTTYPFLMLGELSAFAKTKASPWVTRDTSFVDAMRCIFIVVDNMPLLFHILRRKMSPHNMGSMVLPSHIPPCSTISYLGQSFENTWKQVILRNWGG
jgi:hypothetical protein